ncbi:unnamed protein product [Penicillium egyptiacum]|uniref:chitinase n=1 Tax=Penicillium egyptiacum TaxID=1303716 RepID=A0A9W4K6W0_9EURO|nr:unnamed protein product [Penicillium egyptiacum]
MAHHNLKVLLSVGSWTYSTNFAAALSTPSGQAKFASSATDLVKNLGFDGIDIDWEPLRKAPCRPDEPIHRLLEFPNTAGPGTSFGSVGVGSWEKGIWDYKALPLAGATVHYLPQPLASYSYDEGQQMMVSYDTPQAAHDKAQYIMSKGLGGGMWWESSGDKNGTDSLIATVCPVYDDPHHPLDR